MKTLISKILGKSSFQRKEVLMDQDFPEHFADLGRVLTELRVCDESLFFDIEKLVEVIRLELQVNILPELPLYAHETYSWTDGLNHIVISVHAEGDNQVQAYLDFHSHPN
jgi:hypothetical protein